MPRQVRAAGIGGASPVGALNIGMPQGALNISPPTTRKPTRGALGGATPRGARGKLPTAISSSGARGGKRAKAATPKRKGTKK